MPSSIEEKDIKNKRDKYLVGIYNTYIAQDNAVESDLDELVNDSGNAFSRSATFSDIKDKRRLEADLVIAFTAFTNRFYDTMLRYNEQVADKMSRYEIFKSKDKFIDLVEQNQFVTQAKSMPSKIVDEFATRIRYEDHRTTKHRLKTLKVGYTKTVRNIIDNGTADGKNAVDISRDIEFFIKPELKGKRVSPYKYYRERHGVAKVPKDIFGGSVEYNSLRIARTEIATSRRETTVRSYSGLKSVRGFQWILSSSHPRPDVCDFFANHDEGLGRGVWKSPPASAHPNCFCNVKRVMINQKVTAKIKNLDKIKLTPFEIDKLKRGNKL